LEPHTRACTEKYGMIQVEPRLVIKYTQPHTQQAKRTKCAKSDEGGGRV